MLCLNKKVTLIGLCLLLFFSMSGWCQAVIENGYYSVQPAADFQAAPAFTVIHKAGGLKRTILPRLRLVYTAERAEIVGASMDGQPGVVAWKTGGGQTQDINALGSIDLMARSYEVKDNRLIFFFAGGGAAKVSLVVKFVPGQPAPVFEMGFEAYRPGNYSLGFAGMPQVDSSALDFVYQPLTWSWKRFPSRFALTEEAYANTAAVFTNHHGYSEGLAVSLSDIPYRYALAAQWNNAGKASNKFWSVFPADGPKANSLFGLAIRNPAGKAQPSVFAPLPGTAGSYLKKGDKFHISLVYLLCPGDWQKGTSWLLGSIFHYRSERENVNVSLNTTLDNMLDFAMNDVYSGWNETLKASNYQFDAPGTVKNVSALHPLSLALLTGNEDILRRRAMPMIEYVMSREKFLYSTSDTPGQTQSPSHLLKGPCADIGELVGLDELTGGGTPAFAVEADRLFGKKRQLNMNTETGGGSWQDYLARYRLHHRTADLQKAVEGAKAYLQQVYYHYSRSFFDSPGLKDKGAGFTTDYGYRIYDLFELFLETKDRVFLEAAATGARQLLLWTRSNPAPPAGNIVVNKGGEVRGIFPGRRVSALEGSPFVPGDETSRVPEVKIPAWQTSLNGLVPEAPNTYAFGPVMLAHHAAWLLRLAHYTGDTLFRDAAYNAIVGRYANFPGYYVTSLHTDVYQRADYPRHPFQDVKYNAIFYNHVWPQLALLVDFLVSDFFFRSDGKIDFPGTYAPGYAFLSSQVYGARRGTVMGNGNVQLWMPSRALALDGVAFNYLMGHNERDVFIAFANTSNKTVTEHIRLNRDVIAWEKDKRYAIVLYDRDGKGVNGEMVNGVLSVELEAGGLSCVQVRGIFGSGLPAAVAPGRAGDGSGSGREDDGSGSGRGDGGNKFIRYASGEDSLATVTAMIIQPNATMAVFYAYCNKTEKDWKECSLRYRLNNRGEWRTVRDLAYPFEFDITLPGAEDVVSFEITAVRNDGSTISFPLKTMNQNGALSILGLGDSITEGGPGFFSYLFPLDSLLKAAGWRASFVGPRRSVQDGDTLYHAGFSGRTAEFLAAHIDSIYTAFPADIVLLHAGHNHFVEESPVGSIIQAQRNIIRSIKKINPRALILVAGVITSGKLPKYEYIPELNGAIRRMVDSLKDPTVVFVDQSLEWDWTRYTINDKVHPNRAGAGVIATHWFGAMAGLVSKRGEGLPGKRVEGLPGGGPDSLLPAKELSARGGLPNFFAKVKSGKPVRVAFLGGSITRAGNGYRDQVMNWLRDKYPAAQFEEIMAAVSGTASDFGACRVKQHVIGHKPDLVFVEFAVNDNRMPMQLVRETMEGIVRQIWTANATTDICFLYTFAAENLPLLQKGLFPPSVSAMEAVASHYNIPSIHMGLAVIDEINKGKLVMSGKKEEHSAVPLFSLDGVHPLPETGHKIYTRVLASSLVSMNGKAVAAAHALPPALEKQNWSGAGMISLPGNARFSGNWRVVDSVTKGKEYYPLLPTVYSTASADGALKVRFRGTRFGLADIMGPGTAAVEVTIDKQAPRIISRFDAFCTYYRLNYFILSDLPAGKHTATIRLSKTPIDKAAILQTRHTVVKDWGPYQGKAMYIGAVLY
ncbi:MAG TPA: SGNH/GDSL hydrolase family protein [Puia sp.]|jgi:lysophospholipase L1-like esterase